MIAKKITYELPVNVEETFFLKPPETCKVASELIRASVKEERSPNAEEHSKLWNHVECCLPCIRNVVRLASHQLGVIPLPVAMPEGMDHQAGPTKISWPRPPSSSN
jgi:hypothetical protein